MIVFFLMHVCIYCELFLLFCYFFHKTLLFQNYVIICRNTKRNLHVELLFSCTVKVYNILSRRP